MRVLRDSAFRSAIPLVYAEVHLLRGATDSASGAFEDSGIRLLGAQEKGAVRLGRIRPLGKGNPGAGEGYVGDWPGRTHGVRQPLPGETPLSWSEVMHGIREGSL